VLEPYSAFPKCRILLWNNCPSVKLVAQDYGAKFSSQLRIVNSDQNEGVLARYAHTLLAPTECVLIQDDDVALPASTVEQLYGNWVKDQNSLHGLYGRDFRADGTYADYYDHDNRRVSIVCGRVMMFSRRLLSGFLYYWYTPRVQDLRASFPGLRSCGDDILLSYTAMQETMEENKVYDLPRTELPASHALHADPAHFFYREKLAQMLWNITPKKT
jgi:Glycosyl transferase family 64 domain